MIHFSYMDNLSKSFRKFSIPKLEALQAIVDQLQPVVSTTTISGALTREGQELGGTISALSRTKIDGESLIIPVGRSTDGVLWRLNENIAAREEISKVVNQILDENKEYRMSVE